MLTAGTRLGSYEIVSLLGAGGMGEVYRARDTRLKRHVALKVLPATISGDSGFAARLEHEAHAVAALQHPHICAIYDIGQTGDGAPFLVMELLEGETLQRRLTRGALDLSELIGFGIALADALDLAHRKGIIHRDIKPGNVFLTPHGPKLLDFGLAKTAPPVAAGASQPTSLADTALTAVGIAIGTIPYMSPEQLRGEPLDARTDLFSLGLVLYEMAVGQPVFTGTTAAVISAAILAKAPASPRLSRGDLPIEFEQTILKALEKGRDLRYQTAADLRADLKRIARELASPEARLGPEKPTPAASTASPTEPEVASTFIRRYHRHSIAAPLVAVLAIGLYLAVGRRPQQPAGIEQVDRLCVVT